VIAFLLLQSAFSSVRLTNDLVVNNPQPGELFGQSLATNGEFIVVGAPGRNGRAGAVNVFQREEDGWVFLQTIAPLSILAEDYFGAAVAMKGSFNCGSAWGARSST